MSLFDLIRSIFNDSEEYSLNDFYNRLEMQYNENLTVEVSYTGTSNMKVSVLISMLGALLLVIYIWRMEREN